MCTYVCVWSGVSGGRLIKKIPRYGHSSGAGIWATHPPSPVFHPVKSAIGLQGHSGFPGLREVGHSFCRGLLGTNYSPDPTLGVVVEIYHYLIETHSFMRRQVHMADGEGPRCHLGCPPTAHYIGTCADGSWLISFIFLNSLSSFRILTCSNSSPQMRCVRLPCIRC